VAGGQAGGAEVLGEVQHRVEADAAVAAHARVRGAAGGVAVDEGVDHIGAEALAQIEREVRDAHAMSERAGSGHRLRRAAGARAVGAGVGPELERDRHDLVASVERQLRGGGAVDAAAHGDERAPRALLQADRASLRGRAQRPVQRVGRQLGGVALRRDQAAERVGDRVRRHARRFQQRLALDQLHHRAAGGADGAAALGVEAGLGDPVPFQPDRDSHEVAAGGAAGSAGMRPACQRAQAARGG
jgi:hypothetical protein